MTLDILNADNEDNLNNCNRHGSFNATANLCACDQNFYFKDCSVDNNQYKKYLKLKNILFN